MTLEQIYICIAYLVEARRKATGNASEQEAINALLTQLYDAKFELLSKKGN